MPSRPLILIVAVLGLGQITAFASSFYLLGVLADPMAAGLGVPVGWVFAALSGAFLVSAVVGPSVGCWTDRRGGREVLMVSNVVFATGLILLALAQGPVGMAVGVLTLGLGMGGGLYGTAFAVLVDLYGDAARRPITAVSLLGALGGGLGWPITLVLIQAFSWRGACVGWALAHLLVCLPLTGLLTPRRRIPHLDEPLQTAAEVRWDRRMLQLAILFAGAWAVSTAMSAHLPRLLMRLGLSPAEAAGIAGLTAAAAIGVRLLDLTLLHGASPITTARIAALMHPLGALIVGVGGARFTAALTLCQGMGNGLLSVASGVLPLRLFGRHGYAERHALLLTPARFLQAAGPALYGLALERSATTALMASSVVCLIMFAATLGLERREEA